ncbi:hypothetical protein [Catenulispora pinisilvae]|uniref:hypothetical protein n=1 Tax=Catenulispora pinisilvae TaxID=2705253 RepID=UPI0018913DC2|nr:hypothetical protein [Catenulispora pinisilvae]
MIWSVAFDCAGVPVVAEAGFGVEFAAVGRVHVGAAAPGPVLPLDPVPNAVTAAAATAPIAAAPEPMPIRRRRRRTAPSCIIAASGVERMLRSRVSWAEAAAVPP